MAMVASGPILRGAYLAEAHRLSKSTIVLESGGVHDAAAIADVTIFAGIDIRSCCNGWCCICVRNLSIREYICLISGTRKSHFKLRCEDFVARVIERGMELLDQRLFVVHIVDQRRRLGDRVRLREYMACAA